MRTKGEVVAEQRHTTNCPSITMVTPPAPGKPGGSCYPHPLPRHVLLHNLSGSFEVKGKTELPKISGSLLFRARSPCFRKCHVVGRVSVFSPNSPDYHLHRGVLSASSQMSAAVTYILTLALPRLSELDGTPRGSSSQSHPVS